MLQICFILIFGHEIMCKKKQQQKQFPLLLSATLGLIFILEPNINNNEQKTFRDFFLGGGGGGWLNSFHNCLVLINIFVLFSVLLWLNKPGRVQVKSGSFATFFHRTEPV